MDFPYIYRRSIFFGDTDPGGIVYTPNFSVFCMEAINAWFVKYIGVDWSRMNLEDGLGTPVVNQEINFISPVFANDILAIHVDIGRIGKSSVTVTLDAYREPQEHSAEQTGIKKALTASFTFCFSKKGPPPSPVAIPDHYRTALEAYASAMLERNA